MQLGLIGLGKMGANMNVRLLRGGHEMIVWNRSEAPLSPPLVEPLPEPSKNLSANSARRALPGSWFRLATSPKR